MIRQYYGAQRQGKTTMMIYDAWDFLVNKNNRYKIVTNNPIRIKQGKIERYYPPTNRDEILKLFLTAFNTLFLVDEAHILWPNDKYTTEKFTEDMQNRMANFSKYGNALLMTSQGYNHINKRIRDNTIEVAYCRKTNVNPFWRHVATYYDPRMLDINGLKENELNEKFVQYRRYAYRWKLKKIYSAFSTIYVPDNTGGNFVQPKDLGVIDGLYKGI